MRVPLTVGPNLPAQATAGQLSDYLRREIRRRLPDLRTTGEPAYLQSNFINGIKRLPCAWG